MTKFSARVNVDGSIAATLRSSAVPPGYVDFSNESETTQSEIEGRRLRVVDGVLVPAPVPVPPAKPDATVLLDRDILVLIARAMRVVR